MEIREFRASLRGSLQQPGDAGYDAARRVWNGAIDRKPALIARCAGPADVLGAVNFARTNQLLVSVRGGGHNVTGNAVCDGGLMIDLSPMKGIRVDRQRRTVTAQAGVTWGDLDHETQAFGLATTGGQISTTGIAGLTLGGGLGWLMRKCGLVVDNLLSADVVTADGRFLTASPTENADLFWGLRGGGGNLGLVTSFEYRLHPIGPIVTGGVILHPAERAADALRFYREHMAKAGDDEMVVFAFQSAPPAPFVPTSVHGAPAVGFALCHVGSLDEGKRAADRLRAFGRPLVEQIGPMPYTAVQKMMDEAMPFGRHVYLRSDHLTGLGDDVIETCVRHTTPMTTPLSIAVIIPLGGAVARVGEHDTAFSHRTTPFDIDIFGIWTDPGESDRHLAWGRGFGAALQPFSRGVYINEMGSEGDERIRAAYHPANYARLVTLKNQYDPTNFWRMNQNITPTV
jgi:FAD binding domain-containing protein/berberine-like enzyme